MLSVVIPTLNEDAYIGSLLDHLKPYGDLLEVIVADGGSTDHTLRIVAEHPEVNLVRSRKGRGIQMHAGALAAHRPNLLFLHADSIPPPDLVQRITQVLEQTEVTGGSFCLEFDVDNALLRTYAAFSRINHLLFTYGDQGLFLKRDVYIRLGGFKPMPLMEDVEFQQRIRRSGKFVKIRKPISTSARRYARNGFFRQQMKNNLLVLLYHLGVPVRRLATWY